MATEAKLIARLVADNRDLKRKLTQSQRDLNRFQKNTSKTMKSIQSSFMLAFGGVGIYQVLNKTIGTLAKFEFQMDKVAAISGASDEEINKLTRNAKELGAASKFTATEIGKLQEELAKLGFTTDQIVNMTDAARQLATVADSELSDAAKSVGQIINAFGLEAKDANEIANVMAESFTRSALDLEKFGTAMGNVGANAKAFGLTVSETTAYLAKLVDAGIDASKAGTDLRMILIETNKKGLTLNEAFQKIRDSTDQLGTATDLFGTRAGAAGIILAENQYKANLLNQELSDTTKEMESMVKVMEGNLITDFEKLKSAVDGLILEQGGGLSGWARERTQGFTEMVIVLNQVFTGLQKINKPADLIISKLQKSVNKTDPTNLSGFKRTQFTGGVTDYEKIRLDQFKRGSSSATALGSSVDALRSIDVDTSPIEGASRDYDKAFGLLSNGFEINAEQLEAATSKIEESLTYVGGLGPTLTEQAMEVYPVAKKFGDDLSFVSSNIASGFATMADSIFTGTEDVGEAITRGFANMMRSIGFKFIEAGALFLANSFLAQAATMGIPNPLSIQNNKQAFAAIGIGTILGASGGALSKRLSGPGSGGSGGGFSGDSSGRIGRGGQSVTLDGQFRIQGSDLVYVLDRERSITGRTG